EVAPNTVTDITNLRTARLRTWQGQQWEEQVVARLKLGSRRRPEPIDLGLRRGQRFTVERGQTPDESIDSANARRRSPKRGWRPRNGPALRDANRASEVTTRLRALFSRKVAAIEAVDLSQAAQEVIALSLSELQRNRVTLRLELADDLPAVTGDRVQLQQVILNLLRNASDAMCTVNDRPRELLIWTERYECDQVRLSVKDAVVGFDPKAADRLFEALYTTKDSGMGIGFSLSRSIVESHHGRLWATSNDGPGTTFSFSIPCRFQRSPAADSNQD
ncbi:MAG: ATP-binding protein, partial [Methanomicrobiales archaeon]|nr:ATP-binding protein [Methanomicrobiales archaeon]